jgi:hypothetical protein
MRLMNATYVPNPNAADGQLGTGSNLMLIPEEYVGMVITYVPNPNAADGRGITISGNIFVYDGNPNNNVSCAGPGIVLGEGSAVGQLWFKITASTSSTEWFLILN